MARHFFVISMLFTVIASTTALLSRSVARADTSGERKFSISSSWSPGVRRFLRLEMSDPVYNVLYRYGELHGANNGAYGPNLSAPLSSWFIEYQRAGATDVIAGVLHQNMRMIDEGLAMFAFALNRENASGAFPGSAWPFHGTAFFLSEAAPALVILRYSPFAAHYGRQIAHDADGMRQAARHLVHVVGGVGKIDDGTKNHRWFEAALALGAVGVLTRDSTLITWSRVYMEMGVHMQRQDGVMPENGGHDSGYQALGLVNATRYLELVASGRMRGDLERAVARGEQWEISRIRGDGSVNQDGDTRTRACEERDPAGYCKTTFFAPIFNALARWSVISHDGIFKRAANMVWLQNWLSIPGNRLPLPGLWVDRKSARPGEWVTVWGTRFRPLERVGIYVGRDLVESVRCDQIGSFGGHSPKPNAHFPLPSLRSGRYPIIARGSLQTVRQTEISVITS